ncbi:MAG: uroporphyrinogen decarboxylase family protein [Candidatus Brocadiia bacterium]
MMPSRELVERAATFQGPERVPRDLPQPWGTDFFHIGAGPDPRWQPSVEGEDEWGCVWQKLDGRTMGQVKGHPLDDYARLDDFPFPDYDLPARYEQARQRVREAGEKFVIAGIPLQLMHRLDYLRGNANAMMDPYDHPQELGRLLDIMADIAIDAVRHLAAIGAHGIISADDWGLQDRLFVHPDTFRAFFKPRYHRVYRAAHEAGLVTFLHSCGYITEILDDLVEAELDVIQMDQQENMGVERLGQRFGGRLAFWCPVDIQQTMVHGTLDDIRAYARKLIDTLGRYDGGFMAKWYPAPQAVGHSEERIAAMAEAFVAHGRYR